MQTDNKIGYLGTIHSSKMLLCKIKNYSLASFLLRTYVHIRTYKVCRTRKHVNTDLYIQRHCIIQNNTFSYHK